MKNIHRINGNIYITSYEEIKEGDWTLMFDDFGNLFLCDKPQQYLGIEKGHHLNKGLKKIILTTDPRLAPNCVQSIDDEFLEWFVKNPSCEEVEVINEQYTQNYHKDIWYNGHKIIIPKEETLEEFMATLPYYGHCNHEYLEGVEEGAKWQQERMYSEEDMRKAFIAGGNSQIEEDDDYGTEYDAYMQEWFEQFKKKQ